MLLSQFPRQPANSECKHSSDIWEKGQNFCILMLSGCNWLVPIIYIAWWSTCPGLVYLPGVEPVTSWSLIWHDHANWYHKCRSIVIKYIVGDHVIVLLLFSACIVSLRVIKQLLGKLVKLVPPVTIYEILRTKFTRFDFVWFRSLKPLRISAVWGWGLSSHALDLCFTCIILSVLFASCLHLFSITGSAEYCYSPSNIDVTWALYSFLLFTSHSFCHGLLASATLLVWKWLSCGTSSCPSQSVKILFDITHYWPEHRRVPSMCGANVIGTQLVECSSCCTKAKME